MRLCLPLSESLRVIGQYPGTLKSSSATQEDNSVSQIARISGGELIKKASAAAKLVCRPRMLV